MRVITGKYKGRHFDIPRTFKARPTTDFAKENIFNVLIQYVDLEGAQALDLFSGTGSITLELLSRGCSQVVSIELDRKVEVQMHDLGILTVFDDGCLSVIPLTVKVGGLDGTGTNGEDPGDTEDVAADHFSGKGEERAKFCGADLTDFLAFVFHFLKLVQALSGFGSG